jgi:hypothetical protein
MALSEKTHPPDAFNPFIASCDLTLSANNADTSIVPVHAAVAGEQVCASAIKHPKLVFVQPVGFVALAAAMVEIFVCVELVEAIDDVGAGTTVVGVVGVVCILLVFSAVMCGK